jgi:hypothetical protein
MSELANRNNNGLDVTLQSVSDNVLRVTVTDTWSDGTQGFVLETTDGKKAMDMFYHPFAYYRDRLLSPPREAMNALWPEG